MSAEAGRFRRVALVDTEAARRERHAVLEDIEANPWPSAIAEARLLFDKLGPAIASDIVIEPVNAPGVRGQLLYPPECDRDRVVLFLHGGGYVYGSLTSHGGMAAEVARAAGCPCLQLDYRLAPESPFPAAVDDAIAAVDWLLARGMSRSKLAIVGDSAGGGLTLATLIARRDRKLPLPACAVCVSPWCDLQPISDSYATRRDPMIEADLVTFLADQYLQGRDPRAPTASPLYADLSGLPPVLIQVGESEVLFSEAQAVAKKALAAGVDVEFEEWLGMVHVWHLYYPSLEAGRAAIDRIGDFVRTRTTTSRSTASVATLQGVAP